MICINRIAKRKHLRLIKSNEVLRSEFNKLRSQVASENIDEVDRYDAEMRKHKLFIAYNQPTILEQFAIAIIASGNVRDSNHQLHPNAVFAKAKEMIDESALHRSQQ